MQDTVGQGKWILGQALPSSFENLFLDFFQRMYPRRPPTETPDTGTGIDGSVLRGIGSWELNRAAMLDNGGAWGGRVEIMAHRGNGYSSPESSIEANTKHSNRGK